MKLILKVVFSLQLIIMSMQGILLFRGEALYELLVDDVVIIEVNFNHDIQQFNHFLEILAQHEIEVSLILTETGEEIDIFTTDLTLNGRVNLLDGRFPEAGSEAFISNLLLDDRNQVGVFHPIVPDSRMRIQPIDSPDHLMQSGMYHLHTSDRDLVYEIVDARLNELNFIRVLPPEPPQAIFVLHSIAMRVNSPHQMFETFVLIGLVLACVLMSLLQFNVNKIKYAVVLKLHGMSEWRIIKKIISELWFVFAQSTIVAYLFMMGYGYLLGYTRILGRVTFAFVTFALIFIIFYTLVSILFMHVSLKKANKQMVIIKGQKNQEYLQIANLFVKGFFVIFFLITINVTSGLMAYNRQRIEALPVWEKFSDFHQLRLSSIGQFGNDELEYEFMQKAMYLYDYLSANHGAFVADFSNFLYFEEDDVFLDMDGNVQRFSPWGNRVTVSPNYFDFNPIRTRTGGNVSDDLIDDGKTMNLLVPDHLIHDEAEIYEAYLDYFYWSKIEITNMINRDLDFPTLDIERDDLSLNIIFYESGQAFFSMTPQLSSEMNSIVIDPMVVVYTSTTHHYSFLGAWFTTSFYFNSVSDDLVAEMRAIADEFDLRDAVRGVYSLHETIHGIVVMVTESIYRLTVLMVMILLSHIVVTYHLVANYFEQKKYILFVKKTLGYSSINRNLNFLLILLTLSVCVILLVSFLISWYLLVVGVALLLFDLVVILLFERQLMKKSFAEIMKGER